MQNLKKISKIFFTVLFVIFTVTCQKEDSQKENQMISDTTAKSEIDSPQLKSASVPNYLLNLIGTINSLGLSKGEEQSLISKIDNSIKSLKKGNANAVIGQLSSFKNQVEALIKSGVLSLEQGQLLIKVAEDEILLIHGSFVDSRDGHEYSVVRIGDQIWMAEDLKATKYNDGTDIPNVTDNSEWIALTTGAYCWYDNDENYKNTYGGLYNWEAVSTGKLSPLGWHVPSNVEWETLINYLGGEAIAGGKLKEIGYTHWLEPNSGATNESGFTALPSGDRIGEFGEFYNLLGFGIYWSSDEVPFSNYAINRVLVFIDTNFRIGYDKKTAGFSVRCIKN